MIKEVSNLTEKEVQKLIADYPWLLHIDYETVTEFKDKGMEYILSDNKRADLILRDRTSGRPVIIEFKAVPFYRENIGQILEYKARVISEATNESSPLKEVFGNKILSPIMVLIVPSCNEEARLACNLSGIEVYEYDKSVPEILIPEKKITLEEFKNKFDNKEIPFDTDRHELVERVYVDIHNVLTEENITEGWVGYRNPPGEYFAPMNQLFVNKCLFPNKKISIGICENIFDNSQFDKVTVEYYSEDKDLMIKFIEKYMDLGMKPSNDSKEPECLYDAFLWSFEIDKVSLFERTKELIRPFVKNYLQVCNLLQYD
jgi:hypothetical protein